MRHVSHAECINPACQTRQKAEPDLAVCPECGSVLEIVYDYEQIRAHWDRDALTACADHSMWRYRPLLPVAAGSPAPPLRVGWSPLYEKHNLLGLDTLYIKDDGLNPTASLKDRASALAVVKAREAGRASVACSSTGNAASSLAGNAAACGLDAYIFVPARASQGKLAQLLIFGAHVVSVQGNYEDTFRLSAQAIERFGWYNRNAAVNPYLSEGKKTVALEICEQLHWQAPDWLAISVGDGCTIAGVWKGFYDLYQIGFIDKLPRLLSVQAAGCYPVNRAVRTGGAITPMAEDTIADSIAVGVPRNGLKAVRAIQASNGLTIEVTDEEMLAAMRELGRSCGVFGEPAGVAGLAGLKKAVAQGLIRHDERVVGVVTGNGLKDVANALTAAGQPMTSAPDLASLLAAFAAQGLQLA